MGMSVLGRSCWTNNEVPAPNPSPERWEIQQIWAYDNAYVLKVKYLDCTNYEGMKVMVYEGQYIHSTYLDPHFQESGVSPIARFEPTDRGISLAINLAQFLSGEK